MKIFLGAFCILTVVLASIAVVLVVSLIPIFISPKDISLYDGMPYNAEYSIGTGLLPAGSLSDTHRTRIHTEWSKLLGNNVSISIDSANVVSNSRSLRSTLQRRAVSSQIVQFSGKIRAQGGCTYACLKAAAASFQADLCKRSIKILN